MTTSGQILPKSGFGRALTGFARESDVIVEIGTHDGSGSTLCLNLGMIRKGQTFFGIDCDSGKLEIAKHRYAGDIRMNFIHGTIVLPCEFPEIDPPPMFYAPEKQANMDAPFVLHIIPEKIDLLLIDGSDWTADVEFRKLWNRCSIIALDDSNESKSRKNCRNRERLLRADWILSGEDKEERNGWSIFRRPIESY